MMDSYAANKIVENLISRATIIKTTDAKDEEHNNDIPVETVNCIEHIMKASSKE